MSNGPDEDNCLSCVDFNAFVNSTGHCKCKKGIYYTNYNTCWSALCASCSGPKASECIRCFYSNINIEVSGDYTCDNGYYELDGTCNLCHSTCLTCSNSTVRLSCADSNALVNATGECARTGGYTDPLDNALKSLQ